jgi:hypothetical protein
VSTKTRVDPHRGSRLKGRRTYDAELRALAATYRTSRRFRNSALQLAANIGSRPAVYVGSGGAYAVARFAADVHMARTGSLAAAVTPLLLARQHPLRETAAVIISSRAAHPDVALALGLARDSLMDPVILLTTRTAEEVSHLAAARQVHSMRVGGPSEGFLATRSVLSFATAFAATVADSLPEHLPLLEWAPSRVETKARTLVLYGSRQGAVASDFEARLSETGISACQLADYRNFAHGRHFGLATNLVDTLVVAFVDDLDRPLADVTLAALPTSTAIVRVDTTLPWPASTLDLLVGSMRLTAAMATLSGVEVLRPSVPPFGRRLYRLSSRHRLRTPTVSPVDRKLLVLGAPKSSLLQRQYSEALDDWLEKMRTARFTGVVLDYDGTVCRTDERFQLPSRTVRAALEQILARCVVGVASGRGLSLWRDLRSWLPQHLWDRVELGLYNGTIRGSLAEDIVVSSEHDPALTELFLRLSKHALGKSVRTDRRPTQISLEPGGDLDLQALVLLVTDIATQSPSLPVRLVRSAHSVDVIPSGAAKHAVLDVVAARSGGAILAIGDQGQTGGNDHDLLAATWSTLSVDMCSGDPTRCWNLLDRSETGPTGLVRYLRSLRGKPSALRFVWPAREG